MGWWYILWHDSCQVNNESYFSLTGFHFEQKLHFQSFLRTLTWHIGFKIAPHVRVHWIGLHIIKGKSGLSLNGWYKPANGTTNFLAALRVGGQTFQVRRMPSWSSLRLMNSLHLNIFIEIWSNWKNSKSSKTLKPWFDGKFVLFNF